MVRYYSGSWNSTQKNYSTIKKEILIIVLCITKFVDDLYMKKFLLRIDCLAATHVLEKSNPIDPTKVITKLTTFVRCQHLVKWAKLFKIKKWWSPLNQMLTPHKVVSLMVSLVGSIGLLFVYLIWEKWMTSLWLMSHHLLSMDKLIFLSREYIGVSIIINDG